jgi:hypothetical protein
MPVVGETTTIGVGTGCFGAGLSALQAASNNKIKPAFTATKIFFIFMVGLLYICSINSSKTKHSPSTSAGWGVFI